MTMLGAHSIALLTSGAMIAALLASPAEAQAPPIRASGALVRQDRSDCGNTDVKGTDGRRVGGVVTVQQSRDGWTGGDVSVFGLTPNTNYDLYWKCHYLVARLRTDATGMAYQPYFRFKAEPGTALSFDLYPAGQPVGDMFLSVPMTPVPIVRSAETQLVRQDRSDCANSDVSASDRGRVVGVVVVEQGRSGDSTARVRIDRGMPGKLYRFYWKCQRELGTILTDDRGMGAGVFAFRASPGAALTFDMYPAGEASGNTFQTVPLRKPEYSDARRAIAQRYAPLVSLASGEEWLPSSIDYLAANVDALCNGNKVSSNILDDLYRALPERGQENCYFVTKQALNGPYDRPAFLKGTNPATTKVPIYVFLYSDLGSPEGNFYAQYMTFYPYNLGKNTCTTLAPGDHCLGQRVEMGDHVGDWELVTIRFANGKPEAVHVGSHGNELPDSAWNFFAPQWTKGGADRHVLEWEGTHPVVYSAGGSHGLYGWAGTHTYSTLPTGERLNDHTSRGTPWKTWESIVWADDPRYFVLLNLYEGRWGNPHMGESACDLSAQWESLCEALSIPLDEYQLNDGPSLPDRQRDKNKIHPF